MATKKTDADIENTKSFPIFLKNDYKEKMIKILKNWSSLDKNWSDEAAKQLILMDEIMKIPQIAILIEHYKYFKDFNNYRIQGSLTMSKEALEFEQYLATFSDMYNKFNNLSSSNNSAVNLIKTKTVNINNTTFNSTINTQINSDNSTPSCSVVETEYTTSTVSLDLSEDDCLGDDFDFDSFDGDD